jgi:Putative Actinobacterial Holin-X, holin superfamily III
MQPDDPTPEPEPSFKELVGDLAAEVATLIRQELALVGEEMTHKARDAGKHAILVGIGALLAAVSLLVFVGAVVLGLGSILPMWISALVIAALIGTAGVVAFGRGVAALRSIDLMPTETFASLKADGAWAKQQIGATRDQMAATLGEVRRRLEPPPPPPPSSEPHPPKKVRRPVKRTKSP